MNQGHSPENYTSAAVTPSSSPYIFVFNPLSSSLLSPQLSFFIQPLQLFVPCCAPQPRLRLLNPAIRHGHEQLKTVSIRLESSTGSQSIDCYAIHTDAALIRLLICIIIMDRAQTPAFGLASSLEAMIETSLLATSLERRLTAAINQQLGSDGGSLEDRIAASVNAAFEQRHDSGALTALIQSHVSGGLDQRLGLLTSALDSRIQSVVDEAVQRRLGTALRAQVIFDVPSTQTASPPPSHHSSASQDPDRDCSSASFQHETVEHDDTAVLKQEMSYETETQSHTLANKYGTFLCELGNAAKFAEYKEHILCAKCGDPPDDAQVISCLHVYCAECLATLAFDALNRENDGITCFKCLQICIELEPCTSSFWKQPPLDALAPHCALLTSETCRSWLGDRILQQVDPEQARRYSQRSREEANEETNEHPGCVREERC